jgi:2-keto-4-pentenoate hydratase/2-oxohepta-3-ene-1,7-dioic acid hydratase in catechol pathway
MRIAVLDTGTLAVLDGNELIEVPATATGPGGPLQAVIGGEATIDLAAGRRIPLAAARFGAPLPRPGKVIGAPVNYLEHKAEMSEVQSIAEWGVFLKATSSVLPPDGTVLLPYTDARTDQEGELAVVIGEIARNVSAAQALDHVYGYTCGLDITVRSKEDRSMRKSFDTFTPLGPWVTTADEVGDPTNLLLRCWVDGELRQEVNTREMIFGVADLIAYTSSVMTLWPGDVILTGTPAGVGPINDASSIEVEIERVGRLSVAVSARGAIPYADRPRPVVGAS